MSTSEQDVGEPAVKEKVSSRRTEQLGEPTWRDALVCKNCGMTITHGDYLSNVSGRTEHLQVNPQGITFIFSTYRRAVGVFSAGEATSDYSWFSGFKWQYALCQGCSEHLGWVFNGDDVFFGLLNNKLITRKD